MAESDTPYPRAKQSKIEEIGENQLMISLKSPPVDGKANRELIKLLAKRYGVSDSAITIKSGLSSRQKLIDIDLLSLLSPIKIQTLL
jgi:hypothetical protein